MEKNILILTAGYGEGHNTAARNIASALELVTQGAVKSQVLDLFDVCYGTWNDIIKKAYLGTINHAPVVWEKVYNILDNTRLFEQSLGSLSRVRVELEKIVARDQPAAIVSTYPRHSPVENPHGPV